MKRGSLVGILVYLIASAVVIFLIVQLYRALIPEPPQTEVERAREAIARARDQHSEVYSPLFFREAQNSYDSAMAMWRSENDRFILIRDYERVRSYAALAEKKANEATSNTISRSNSLRVSLTSDLSRLQKEMASFEKIFLAMPLPQDLKKKHARGKLLLREAEIDLQKENYVNGNIRITEANEYISGSYNLARKTLEGYFRNYPDWQEWAMETIKESRNRGSYAILIEKIPSLCHLYQGGKKKYTFEAEFGSNWLGDKKSRVIWLLRKVSTQLPRSSQTVQQSIIRH
jgi:hypothetical protein